MACNGAARVNNREPPQTLEAQLTDPNDDPDALIFGPREAAQFYRVHLSSLHAMVRDGRLPPPARIGPKSPRWSKRQLMAAAERMRDAAPPVMPKGRNQGRPRKRPLHA